MLTHVTALQGGANVVQMCPVYHPVILVEYVSLALDVPVRQMISVQPWELLTLVI